MPNKPFTIPKNKEEIGPDQKPPAWEATMATDALFFPAEKLRTMQNENLVNNNGSPGKVQSLTTAL